ncbi:vacuolar protein sorting/targeting protein 10 [Mycena rosella]|uniref:Vacuolar protein sorting/targeting protein 10 n=1 Tax=Mycena rosella TaxID=1033263 RepID=A0AAD7GD03_MYCRO|nr:vacuolar protein sorting/targeting protein 10 [Mycena rosella]
MRCLSTLHFPSMSASCVPRTCNYLFRQLAESAVFLPGFRHSVYVSSDEGRIWTLAKDIPTGVAALVIEHPFDSSYAFILTRSTMHFRTENRGMTWRAFEVPIPPAVVAAPLSFHSDPQKYGYILYQGTVCSKVGHADICHEETYVTKDAFSSPPRPILGETSRCQFAHGGYNSKPDVHSDLVYCVVFDTKSSGGDQELSSSRLTAFPECLFSSTDFFDQDMKIEELGIGKSARGDISLAILSNFAVFRSTRDFKTWTEAHFPDSTRLREGAFTIVESRTADSNGTFFVHSLADTNRHNMGFVDYEPVYGVTGFGIVNVEGWGKPKQLKTLIPFDDGASWAPIRAPLVRGASGCNPDDTEFCSLHLHLPTIPQYTASLVPGVLVAVGSLGRFLLPYEDCETFLSTDGGVTWDMVRQGPHKLSFADSGSILLAVPDEEGVDGVYYSMDSGKTWEAYDFGLKLRPLQLGPSDSPASQKFIMLGQVARKDQSIEIGPHVMVSLDFSHARRRKCTKDDFESWYAKTPGSECIMGRKQRYKRRKPKTKCYVGDRLTEPVEYSDRCPCTDTDYECDYNYVRMGDQCVPVGPETIPAGACRNPWHTYMGSSGYRKVPGNVCIGGRKDQKIQKPCEAFPEEGDVIHQEFRFPNYIVQHAYFPQSTTILVRLTDQSIWQSSNEGYTWNQLFPREHYLAFYHHKYASGRAYLITKTNRFYTTTDSGRKWNPLSAPIPPNTFHAQVLRFHPDSDKLIWTGNKDCDTPLSPNWHAEAHYSRDNGRRWTFVENYVANCAWVMDIRLNGDPTAIVCESHNPLALVEGSRYFTQKTKLFNDVVGFAKFSEYWLVAELLPERDLLELQVSLGGPFATARFPTELHPSTHAYTVLESTTGLLFIHVTVSEPPDPYWGTIIKSNSNGTFFGISLSNVNRDDRGFVDFEKIYELDGIALANVVANPDEPLTPPSTDSDGNKYKCDYKHWQIVGVLIAVGNVGESLASYDQSNTFLSRDAGLTWEEVRKDPYMWEFGDSGSILVMAREGTPTDRVLFSTNEGLHWREYRFTSKKMHVQSIVTIPSATSRRFVLIGNFPSSYKSTVIHLDFTSLTSKQCVIDVNDPGHDDFELWSPTDGQRDQCLFGRQTFCHRRVRETNCVVGAQILRSPNIQKNCTCTKTDFECEFNYYKNEADECVPGATPLPNDPCDKGQDHWYERTAYRRISYSTCEGGERLDRGTRHRCPISGPVQQKGSVLWFLAAIWIFILMLLVVYWCYSSCLARRRIQLPEDDSAPDRRTRKIMVTVMSIPLNMVGAAWAWTAYRFKTVFHKRSGQIELSMDHEDSDGN